MYTILYLHALFYYNVYIIFVMQDVFPLLLWTNKVIIIIGTIYYRRLRQEMEKETEAERKKLNELRMKSKREMGEGEVKLR